LVRPATDTAISLAIRYSSSANLAAVELKYQ
jgi:hypothetical protein